MFRATDRLSRDKTSTGIHRRDASDFCHNWPDSSNELLIEFTTNRSAPLLFRKHPDWFILRLFLPVAISCSIYYIGRCHHAKVLSFLLIICWRGIERQLITLIAAVFSRTHHFSIINGGRSTALSISRKAKGQSTNQGLSSPTPFRELRLVHSLKHRALSYTCSHFPIPPCPGIRAGERAWWCSSTRGWRVAGMHGNPVHVSARFVPREVAAGCAIHHRTVNTCPLFEVRRSKWMDGVERSCRKTIVSMYMESAMYSRSTWARSNMRTRRRCRA